MADLNFNIPFNPPENIRTPSLVGQRFGRLLVVSIYVREKNCLKWLCLCDCGNWHLATKGSLTAGHVQSCGCFRREALVQNGLKHGYARGGQHSREYDVYHNAKGRCNNPKNPVYPYYGGRGIEFRFASVQELIDDIGFRPSDNHSLDRIDNEGHYEVRNVKWSTKSEQGQNRRSNVLLTYQGVTKCLSEWAKELPIPYTVLLFRIRRFNWTTEKAFTTPVRITARTRKV